MLERLGVDEFTRRGHPVELRVFNRDVQSRLRGVNPDDALGAAHRGVERDIR